jgi:hypothetical protein
MPLADFLALPYYKGKSTFPTLLQTAGRVAMGQDDGVEGNSLPIGFRPGNEMLYTGVSKL